MPRSTSWPKGTRGSDRLEMNPRVRRWRDMYYPEITDWSAYNKGTTPYPR